jgi:hypothetical protein
MNDLRLLQLLKRAVEHQRQYWFDTALIECVMTENKGFTSKQVDTLKEVISKLALSENDPDESSCEYLKQEIQKSTPAILPVSSKTPMAFDEFSQKYVREREKAGDYTDPNDLTAAYAVYCQNPDGHWLHKE